MWIEAQHNGLYFCTRISWSENDNGTYRIVSWSPDKDTDILGIYSTKERVMAVLKEIKKEIERIENTKLHPKEHMYNSFIYLMPKPR